jgi:hypothetical protein
MFWILLEDPLAAIAGTSRDEVSGAGATTVKAALSGLLARHPRLRPGLLADTGALRPDVALFLDASPVGDRIGLSDVLQSRQTLHVMRSRGPRVGMCWSTDWRERRWSQMRHSNVGALRSEIESAALEDVLTSRG